MLILLINAVTNLQAQKTVKEYLESRNEAYIKIKYNSENDIEIIKNIVYLDNYKSKEKANEIYAYINQNQYNDLLKTNFEFEVQTPPSMVKAVDMCVDNNAVENWNCYPTYDQYVYLMNKFAADYPEICSLHEIGNSVENRKVLALKISDNVELHEEEPAFFYTSTMHGDEVVGYILMLRLTSYLLSNYETDDRIKELINKNEIWINPLANPDGTYASGNSTVNDATRTNANSFDLNRNFPDPVDGEYPNGTRQPETQDMMSFMQTNKFSLSANFHGGAEVVNYPWDTWSKRHADDLWYQNISAQYADTVHDNSSGYMTGFVDGITNGNDWYWINGGRQDYVNYYLHSRETTIELSQTKMPAASELNNYWNYNYRSFLNYIAALNTGVKGKTTDIDGNPIKAKVYIQTDSDSSEVYSEAENGMFYRLLNPGNYNFIFKTSGYLQKEFTDIYVYSGNQTELNVQFDQIGNDPDPDPDTNPEYSNKLVSFQNPFIENIQFEIELAEDAEIQISIYNISGKKVLETDSKLYFSGPNSFTINTQSLFSGFYVCIFKSVNFSFKLKLVKV
ncbi:MAG: T9SS type A sorting domain-containing protein [Bacteroidales bacterium]|nr:T9SS type A sorting domain-containing protein [Bacteroidales bacterium]MBN2755631.1 T9SS type A sorting domain-containing protein [Bacteroidales bacterium]